MNCQEKVMYKTRDDGDIALAKAVAHQKRTGAQGKSWKRLVVYPCRDCKLWHIGHVRQICDKEIDASKPPTHGQLRRKLARLETSMDKRRRYQVQEIGKIVDRDKQQMVADELQARQIAEGQ